LVSRADLVYIMAVAVGIGVGRLVLENLDQPVKDNREDRTKKRSNPVDPVVAVKAE